MTLSRFPWLVASFLAAAVVWCIFIGVSYDISYWYDEVFTLGAAGVNGQIDWEMVGRDVHPPTHILLVHWTSGFVNGADPALRAVNLLSLIPIGLAALVLRRECAPDQLALLALLIMTGLLFFHLTLELRVYGLLLAASILGHALLLARIRGRRFADPCLVATALVLTSLHFFGAALATALLLTSAALHMKERATLRALILAGFAGLCVLLTLTWAFVIGDVRSALGGNLWIRNELTPYLRFVGNQPVLFVYLLALLILSRRGLTAPAGQAHDARWMLLPFGMVIGVALIISLHTPVISTKNLTVGIPGLALFAVLSTPDRLLRGLNASPLTLAATLLLTGYGAFGAGQSFQYIRWTIEQAGAESCAGLPLYVIGPDIVDIYAQQVFLGQQRRPLRELREIGETFDPTPYQSGCPVIAVGWHEPGSTELVERFLTERGLNIAIIQSPDARPDQAGLMSPGFVAVLSE